MKKKDLKVEKWNWKMDYCKKKGFSPAKKIFWNEAEEEFNKTFLKNNIDTNKKEN